MGIRKGPVIRRAGDAPACPGNESLQSSDTPSLERRDHEHDWYERNATQVLHHEHGAGRRGGFACRGWQRTGTAVEGSRAGDVAILRFLAAAELIEADLWQQYAELANNNPAYQTGAAQQIDPDMVAYIQQNTNDEFSHQAFLNDFLISQNLEPVDLDAFRNLPSSHGDRGGADRAIDQPDEPQRGYELVLALPELR